MKEIQELCLVVVGSASSGIIGHYFFLWIWKLTDLKPLRPDVGARWIGILERILVTIFIFLGFPKETIFIFAAKAAIMGFRIPKNGSHEDQKEIAEYMLIGSMISYLIALGFGYIGRLSLRMISF